MKQGKSEQGCQDNALGTENTLFQQHRRQLYTWTAPDGQYQNQIDYILCSQRWRRSSIKWTKIRPGADCDSDHELLIAKFRLKLKKIGKNTRPFRYQSVSSVAQSRLTLWSHGLQHARPPCPSPTLRIYSNSCPLSWRFRYDPFRYDLHQIPYDYTVEVIKRFRGLDLVNSEWRTLDRGS